jgi:cytochrome c-type biogenesis protein CcmH
MKQILTLIALCFMLVPALAVEPDEMLDDPTLETRARDISANLRCLVCQNQSIDDSDADLAKDLRVLVRERLVEGDSDEQVVEYVVSRYGEFVLLKPKFALHTLVLWLAAPLILVVGLLAILPVLRRKPVASGAQEMTDAERAALAELEKGDENGGDEGRV